jgi:uncharacterized protein YcfL
MKKVLACALLLLTGCRDHRPPAPTAEQSQQLNDAEDMLNATAHNEEGPEDRSPGPSNSNE